ncbi:hypothetical protein ACM66B_005267 [Microbotryomycetes sp. NB124-2]
MQGGLDYSAFMPSTSVDGSVLSWTALHDGRARVINSPVPTTLPAPSLPPSTYTTNTDSTVRASPTSSSDAYSERQPQQQQHSVSGDDLDHARQHSPARKRLKHTKTSDLSNGSEVVTVAAAAATTEQHLADKSCKTCRQRKVRCDRKWPKCGRCTLRGLECHLGELVPLAFVQSQPHPAEIKVAELEARIASLERDLTSQNLFLPHAARFVETIDLAVKGGDSETAQEWMKHREASSALVPSKADLAQERPRTRVHLAGQLSAESRARHPELQRSFSLHLLEAFFGACCSSLPVFRPWHSRLPTLFNLHDLDAPDRVAVATFCAIGARSTPHSALLGILDASEANADTTALASSGIRREQACRALNAEAIDLYEKLSIADDTSRKSLEATMTLMQSCIFNELVPRRSRSMVRTALGQFKDLLDLADTVDERTAMVMLYGLPLLHADSITSAYGRKSPLVTQQDLDTVFGNIQLPDLSNGTLSYSVSIVLSGDDEQGPHEGDYELDHVRLTKASMLILRWIVQTQREFARIASPRACSPPLLQMDVVVSLWSALDQIHSSIQNLQHYLINFDDTYLPKGCEQDGCQDLHLRFVTRMSREVDNVTSLVHSLLNERKVGGVHCRLVCRQGDDGEGQDDVGEEWLEESEKRVRKSLKLAAFYFEVYSISIDPHQCYYLAWQLELLPSWTLLAVQRYGEHQGPLTSDLELTETELDWIEKGLKVAMSYHPVAEKRLAQVRAGRRMPRESSLPSRASNERPGLRLPLALKQTLKNAVPSWR